MEIKTVALGSRHIFQVYVRYGRAVFSSLPDEKHFCSLVHVNPAWGQHALPIKIHNVPSQFLKDDIITTPSSEVCTFFLKMFCSSYLLVRMMSP